MVTDTRISPKWYRFGIDDERTRNLLVEAGEKKPFSIERVDPDTVKVWFYEKKEGEGNESEIHFVPSRHTRKIEDYDCEYMEDGQYLKCKLAKQEKLIREGQ